MTSRALSPGTKTPLENTFQNLKHKTPVNQHVRQSSQNNGGHMNTHHVECRKLAGVGPEMAAIRIQRWYRKQRKRQKAGQAAIKRLMEAKRQEKQEERAKEAQANSQSADGRKRQREERARQARQEAIKELQAQREAKRSEAARIAEEEIAALQSKGKLPRKSNVQKQHANAHKQQNRINNPGASMGLVSVSNNTEPAPVVDDVRDVCAQESPERGPRDDARDTQSENSNVDNNHQAIQNNDVADSQITTKTTLEDLMDTLRKLEEEEKLDTKDVNTTPANWLDDLERECEGACGDSTGGLTAERLNVLTNQSKDNLTKNSFLTDDKLRSIMSFLEEVETADRVSEIEKQTERSFDRHARAAADLVPLVPSGEEVAALVEATTRTAEVTNTVLAQRMQLDERTRTVSMLQKALNQQRELTVRHAKETERDMKKRLDVQKGEAEDTIKRHLGFIDQLIDDKKTLSEKCEHLVKELKSVDKKYQDKIKSITDNNGIEMTKIKDMQAAAEKLRRERWIDEKTKKIKEMTVKGLEPEIQRLIAKHKEEVRKVKSVHEAELLASDERAGQRYITMTEQLREQLQAEKETACQRERELARQTYESQLGQEEAAFQAQRRRLHSEVQEEKERIAQSATRQRAELDRLQRQTEDNQSKSTDALRQEYEKARDEQERRHATETRQLREQLTVEKNAWEENYRKKQETWLLAKERELKESVRRERDKEIEMVIGRLEEDGESTRSECERLAENRIKRVRDKYEGEVTELERSERLTTEKYNQTKAKLAELEGENERMKVTLKQKDKEVDELKKLLDKLNEERSYVSDVIRQEFADRLVAVDEENKRIKTEHSESKARHRIEIERTRAEIEVVTKTKQEEMVEVHKRVKQAIVKKEDVVSQLRAQFEAAQKRADHLEGLLEQQRKQLLAKK